MFRKLIKKQLLIESDEVRIKFKMDIPSDIRKIQKVFKSKGKDLYLVGGAVRDSLLKKPIKDWDLATDATPDEVIQMLKVESFITNIIETGKSFGVINALTDNDEYEIATFRSESGYEDSRRPSNVEFSDIATDVMRRDLTINALFYDLGTNEVVDLVGGVEDLKNGIVRTVGNAGERFDEDKLRILRAIRFAGRFGSEVDDDIDKILQQGVDMSQISGERIRDEFIKGIKTSKSTVHFLGLMNKYDLLKQVFPNIMDGYSTDSFMESNDPDLVIASLLMRGQLFGDVAKHLNGLKYPSEQIKNIQFLIYLTKFNPNIVVEMRKMREKTSLSDEQIMEFARFNNLDEQLVSTFLSFDLTVNGNEVMQKFGLKGADVGKKIKELEINNFRATI